MISDLVYPSSEFTEEEKILTEKEFYVSNVKENISGLPLIGKFYSPLTEQSLKLFFKEAELYSKLDHKSIAHLERITFSSKNFAALLFDQCSNGSLNDAVFSAASFLNDNTIIMKIIYGTASAMNYLHEHNICLTNFNTSSVFLDENLEPKIFDMSGFRTLKNDTKTFSKENFEYKHENLLFIAPELLDKEGNFHISETDPTEKVDVYSFGVFVYHLLTGELTNTIEDNADKLSYIVFGGRPEFPDDFPLIYRDFVEMCWDTDPQSRPSFKDILETISLQDYVLDGTDMSKYNEYIEKVKTTRAEDKENECHAKMKEQEDELEAAAELTDFLKTTLQETTTQFADQYEKLTKQLADLTKENEELRCLIPPKVEHEDFGVQKYKEDNKMEYAIVAASAAIATLCFSYFVFRKKK